VEAEDIKRTKEQGEGYATRKQGKNRYTVHRENWGEGGTTWIKE
jgi:hypothetical protein